MGRGSRSASIAGCGVAPTVGDRGISYEGRGYGAAASVTALSKLASASTRTIGRSSAALYGASASRTSGRCEAAIPTFPTATSMAAKCLRWALVDGAIQALLLVKPPPCPWAHSDPDVGPNHGAERPCSAAPSRTHSRALAAWLATSSSGAPRQQPRRRGDTAEAALRPARCESPRAEARGARPRPAGLCRSAQRAHPTRARATVSAGSIPRRSTSAAIWTG